MALLKEEDEVATVRPRSRWFYFIVVLCVIAVILFIIGVVLISVAASKIHSSCADKPSLSKDADKFCDFSDEAKRAGFDKFLDKVKQTYYDLHPWVVYDNPQVRQNKDKEAAREFVRKVYTAYDPSPSAIKKRTDAAMALLQEIKNMKVDKDKLRPRERKAFLQVQHFLQLIFGNPYEANFYAGDWMLGPDIFCYVGNICRTLSHLKGVAKYLKPRNLDDVKILEEKLKTHKSSVETYTDNMRMGVRKGMVRNTEACLSGMYSIGRAYYNISRMNETGVFNETSMRYILSDDYYSDITTAMNEEWKKSHNGQTVQESVKEYLLEYIGKPVVKLLRYIKDDHLQHCVNSTISSGLASLPLKFVYTNNIENTSWPTDPTLPLDGGKLDGKKTYSLILPYFTTTDITPADVHKLGYERLNKLYPQAVEVAKQVTNITDETEAVKAFRAKLVSREMYFNKDPIPESEMGDEAFKKCSNPKDAEKNCPKRWEALQAWFKEARMAMSLLAPKINDMFYYTGDKDTVPNCPIDMFPDLNPASGIQSYDRSDKTCSKPALYSIPFWLKDLGPRYSEWSVNAHESRPGHHLQIQGTNENFKDDCKGQIAWLNNRLYYTAFTEGWALYAENPIIAEDTDAYNNEPMQRYGMLKWQIWRAIRLIVDSGLHYTGMTRAEAIKLFDEKAWDGTDFTEKEVTRYQSVFGQATAYMIGQQDIIKARKYAKDNLGGKFNLKDFHYQVLSQGSSPLAYLSDHIKRYVECAKDPGKTGCDDILNPPKMVDKQGRKQLASDEYESFQHTTHYA